MTAQANAPTRLYTADEFEALIETPEYRDRRLELIDGEMVEKMVTQEHGAIILMIGYHLIAYLRVNPIGRAGTEVHHRAAASDRNVRIPDIGVIVHDPSDVITVGSVPRLPDLAVEVKSPSNTFEELREKARFYLANGTRIVWIVIPAKRLVEVQTISGIDILDATDTLTGGDVLPGFTLPVAEIFRDTQAESSNEGES